MANRDGMHPSLMFLVTSKLSLYDISECCCKKVLFPLVFCTNSLYFGDFLPSYILICCCSNFPSGINKIHQCDSCKYAKTYPKSNFFKRVMWGSAFDNLDWLSWRMCLLQLLTQACVCRQTLSIKVMVVILISVARCRPAAVSSLTIYTRKRKFTQ